MLGNVNPADFRHDKPYRTEAAEEASQKQTQLQTGSKPIVQTPDPTLFCSMH